MSRPELPRVGLLAGTIFRARLVPLALAGLAAVPLAQVGSVIGDQRIGPGSPGFPATVDDHDFFGTSIVAFDAPGAGGSLDLLVGARNTSSSLFGAGAVYALSILSDGTVTDSLEITTNTGGFTGQLQVFDEFGGAVALIGDVDGDGIEDAAVGAPGAKDSSGTSTDFGAVWILFLNADHSVKGQSLIGDSTGGFSGTLVPGSRFGYAIAPLGDLDQDGTPDIAVGAPADRLDEVGSVWLLFLRPDGTVGSEVQLDHNTPELGGLYLTEGAFGTSLASPGDLDGDGLPDLAVGIPLDGTSGIRNHGSVLLMDLTAAGGVASPRLVDLIGVVGTTAAAGMQFGLSLASVGDLVGDGGHALVVGSTVFGLGVFLSTVKSVWVVDFGPLGTSRSYLEINPQRGSLTSSVAPADDFGRSMAGIGDLDGDGIPDLAVGADEDSQTSFQAGAMYLLHLSDGDPAADFTSTPATTCPPASVSFTDTSTGAGLLAWSWSFGDGTSSSEESPTHVYTAAGTYDVALTVTGSGGTGRKVVKRAIVVRDAPVADFSATPTTTSTTLPVTFTDESSTEVTSWLWDFGDGSTSSLQNPSHAYLLAGTYDVSLTASCGTGSDVETKPGYVVVLDGPPASVTSCNGSGVNPDVLTSLNNPVLGTTWMVQVDGSALGASGLAFFFSYQDPLSPGLLLGLGELLIDPTSPFVALDIVVLTGGVGTHAIPIPGDASLLGFTASAQELLNNVGGRGQLTNRLDAVLGN